MRRIATAPRSTRQANLVGEVVIDRAGKVGVVTAKANRTQVVVNYGPGQSSLMHAAGLRIHTGN
jgi:hypothetical protein